MSRTKHSALLLSFLACISFWSPQANAGNTPTTTLLTVSSDSIPAGSVLSLTASISSSNGAVNRGTVKFCNAAAAYCDGAAVFGSAQVTSAQTAAIKLRLGVGIYQVQAEFTGFQGVAPSVSATQAVTVTGAANYGSAVAFSKPGGTAGDYSFGATLLAFGRASCSAPVLFRDTSHRNTLLATAVLNPASQIFSYLPSSPITSETAAWFVATGDFNNDGIPDLAIANHDPAGTIGILLGNGDGTFQPSVEYGAGQYPGMLVVADVNHDGNLDLIATNSITGSVSVLLGTGDGTFHAAANFGAGALPQVIAVGDFNGDGLLDLAITNNLGNTVSVLIGNGDGTFQPPAIYGTGLNPVGLEVGDFNDDGILDLATANSGDGTLSILQGNGDGTFQPKQTILLPDGASPVWVTSGDLRNNGRSDLAVSDGNQSDMMVLLSNGNGTFQPPTTYDLPMPAPALSVADMNGDGLLDLLIPDPEGGGFVSVMLGNGDGTFAAHRDYPAGNHPLWLAEADFNGDGMPDVVTADTASNTSTILLQMQTETAAVNGVAVFGAGTHNIVADYPGDADHTASQSAAQAIFGIPPTPTTTSLSATPNPARVGRIITFAAVILPAPSCLPTLTAQPNSTAATCSMGSVRFYCGKNLLGEANVNSSGMATFNATSSSLPPGSNAITAVYSGNGLFDASNSAALSESIIPKIPTTTVLSVSPNPASAGGNVTLKATISPIPTDASPGAVTLFYGGSTLCDVPLNSAGIASFPRERST